MITFHFKSEEFRSLSSQNIWAHLENFFDLEKADLVEKNAVETPEEEVEFYLPFNDYDDAIARLK